MASLDSERFYKVVTLLVEGGSKVLRRFLLTFVESEQDLNIKTIDNFFLFNQGTLFRLLKRRILTESQSELIFPPNNTPVDLDRFDITLLCVLLKSICKLSDEEEDEIDAIRNHRNTLYAHTEKLKLTAGQYEAYWNDICTSLTKIANRSKDRTFIAEITAFIRSLSASSLGVTAAADALKQWYLIDTRVAEELQKVRESVEQMRQEQSDLNRELLDVKQQLKDLKISPNDSALQKSSKAFIQAHTRLGVVWTTCVRQAESFLQETNSVVISGQPGEGKTVAGATLIATRYNPDRCLVLSNAAEWQHVHLCGTEAILIDDIFGTYNFEKTLLLEWMPILSKLQALVDLGELHLIVVTRANVLKECIANLRRFKIFNRVVEFSSHLLQWKDKERILTEHLKEKNRSMSAKAVQKCIRKFESPVGFPFCCRLFCSQNSLYKRESDFFKMPLAFFKDTIETLEKRKYVSLVYLFCRGGTISSNDFTDSNRKSEIANDVAKIVNSIDMDQTNLSPASVKSNLDHLLGAFVMKTEDKYKFIHSTVSKTIGFVYGRDNPEEVLRLCSSELLHQCLSLEDLQEYQETVFIPSHCYQVLARRLMAEIIDHKHVVKTANHKALRHEMFMKYFVEKLSNSENSHLFFKTGETIMLPPIVTTDSPITEYFLPNYVKGIFGKVMNFTRLFLNVFEVCTDIPHSNNMSCWKCKMLEETFLSSCAVGNAELCSYLLELMIPSRAILESVVKEQTTVVEKVLTKLQCLKKINPEDHLFVEALELVYKLNIRDCSAMLLAEGVAVTPKCVLNMAQYGNENDLKGVICQLKTNKTWDTRHPDVQKALVSAYYWQQSNTIDVLKSEGVLVESISLYYAVEYESETLIRSVISEMKLGGTWDPKHKYASEALEEAYLTNNGTIVGMLLAEDVAVTGMCALYASEIQNDALLKMAIQRIKELNQNPQEVSVGPSGITSENAGEVYEAVISGNAVELFKLIRSMKTAGTWTSCAADATAGLVHAFTSTRADIVDVLLAENVDMSPECLYISVSQNNKTLLRTAIDYLKKTNKWNVDNEFVIASLLKAHLEENTEMEGMLVSEDANLCKKCSATSASAADVAIVKMLQKLLLRHVSCLDDAVCARVLEGFLTGKIDIKDVLNISNPSSDLIRYTVDSGYIPLIRATIHSLRSLKKWNPKDELVCTLLANAFIENKLEIVDVLLSEGCTMPF